MKRRLSSLDPEPTSVPAAPPPKRAKAVPLTHEALSKVEVPQSESAASVNLWVSSCAHVEEMDPIRPHPRLLAQTSRRAKGRSRTPSPVKKLPHCATPGYRNGTMKLARVFIERDHELPAHIAASIDRIFGMEATRNTRGQKGDEDTARNEFLGTLAETYRTQCQSLASDGSCDGEWRSCIYSILMSPLSERWSPMLKVSASGNPWNKHLKPTILQLPTLAVRPRYPIVYPPPSSATRGAFPSQTAKPTQDDTSTSSAVSTTTASDYSTDDILHLSTPKPDITVGLTSDCITNALHLPQDILLHLQSDPNNSQPFVSDPHQVPLGLRFPFMIVEAKGRNTGGNLIHAQNQAAVAAASALNILGDLDALIPNFDVDAELSNPTIIFSLATEGPTHELWVHYRTRDEYHMSCIGSWRATLPGHTESLVKYLGRVMEWGAGNFKDRVVERVGALWSSMCMPEDPVIL